MEGEIFEQCDKCCKISNSIVRVAIGVLLIRRHYHYTGSGKLCEQCYKKLMKALAQTGIKLKRQQDDTVSTTPRTDIPIA